jgi:ketosteroid isomerase-like protein
MKRSIVAGGLALLSVLFCGTLTPWRGQNGSSVVAPGIAEAASSGSAHAQAIEEVKALLVQHDQALSKKDLHRLMGTFATGANTVVLGTGPGERWVGPQQIKEAYTHIFQGYDTGTLTTSPEWRTGGISGSMGYLAGTWQAKDSLKGKVRQYALNVSAAMQKQSGKWRIIMLHMSNPTGPTPAR